jgi:hypothetical protein
MRTVHLNGVQKPEKEREKTIEQKKVRIMTGEEDEHRNEEKIEMMDQY